MNPIRSCIGCRKRENPSELLRVVCVEGRILPDPDRTASGRGAWVHRRCAVSAVEHGALGRAFRHDGSLDVKELIHFINEVTNEMDAKDMKLK
ncbi:MAG: DUF448 domain-containing protein [Actinobacteria bacterium]|nr:YlxR family protein [Actinomycetota bacterium]MSV63942.1 DUF448 domain-containing protein [Actinomycetota bacterium]MSW25876.1 DUF448 domain-containing protein [Actinomycetota bacterium]MSW34168.1 DUF448 domain-containing protein [Actinomycetota bacterium]MSX30730.1 DUF448 domain-containing protein [Actinomycetota bacterium]